jgi:YebC/PmpR family DNA-binding regulatory protein
MSGHSKWNSIKHQKGAADAKRGALFTKLGKAITVSTKQGGRDLDSNFQLRLAVDQAKSANMPKDNIERAIKRGMGELEGGVIEEIVYEGFGPDGTAFIIETLTDNRNRTSSAMKHILTKYGGSLGAPNSVAWMFEKKGVVRLDKVSEELELELIDAGALDIKHEEDGFTIYTLPNNLKKIKELVEKKGIVVEFAEVGQVAKEKKIIPTDKIDKIQKVFAELEENEDINNFHSNAEV